MLSVLTRKKTTKIKFWTVHAGAACGDNAVMESESESEAEVGRTGVK